MSFFYAIPSPTVSSFQLGPVVIHFYALFILAGIIVATIVTSGRMKARGMEPGLAIDVAIWAVPFGIIGGRLFHVFTHYNDYFGEGKDWTTMFRLWEGGLAIYGALIFGVIGAYLACQVDIKPLRIESAGIRFLSFADALVPGLLAAQALGRWGNFFNSELFGEPTDLPWGLEISSSNPNYPIGLPEGILFHPTFLYESLWSLLGIAVLLLVEQRFNMRWGRMFAAYLMWYSFGRFFVESIRLDPSDVFMGLRTNQWSALLGFLIGFALLMIQRSRHTGIEETGYLPGRSAKPQPAKTSKKQDTEVESLESSDQE
ncbi:MAG: prolipoprotein diacylglyceryl transferase [Actinobacteria bacterium]|nr:prolipoprotein diacylglyceryl transferase [Actinomycetota bacterium]